MQGLRAWLLTEQVGVFTWALGPANKPGPVDFDSAMSGKNGTSVFVFARCLSSSTSCNFSKVSALLKRAEIDERRLLKAKKPIPGVPPALKGKIYRGLQINRHSASGEYRFSFGSSVLNITSPNNGPSYSFKVSMVGDFRMWWTPAKPSKNDFVVKSLWALDGGPATEFLNLATGYGGMVGPANFSAGMLLDEFILAGCQEPYPNQPPTCIFR